MGPFDALPANVATNNNYRYDELGQLIYDEQENIASIQWRNDGKIKRITRTGTGPEKNLSFTYDPSGNRLSKKVYDASHNLLHANYYIRDASGNPMAIYKLNIDPQEQSLVYTVAERNIYGSERLGIYTYPDTVYPVPPPNYASFKPIRRGYRKYELKNHLGNVTAVVNGNKIPVKDDNSDQIAGYHAIIEAAYDYSPFGVTRKNFERPVATASAAPNPLAPNYRWCFDGDGTEANGSNHDAIMYNMLTVDNRDNEAGKALESAGDANSYMEIPHHQDLTFGGNDFTVGIWVKRLALNDDWNHTIAVGKWHSGQESSKNEWYLAISNGGGGNNPPQFAIQTATAKYTAGGSPLPVGGWYHLVGVREGEHIKLYVDGSLVATEYVGNAVVNTIPNRNIYIGRMGNGKYLKAAYDEFVVYHRALSASEVNELYSSSCDDFVGEEEVAEEWRWGFGNQEKDDEIKGSGNSIAFKYRIHDTRLGRFMSVDPLSKEYPWNSSYAFAENSPIAFIDLEGLERYFAADGSYLGKLGTSNKMRVVAQSDVKSFAAFKGSHMSDARPPVFDASKQFHDAKRESQENIARTIYGSVINKGGSLNSVKTNPANDGTGMSMSLGASNLTIYPNLTGKGGEYILDDYYNFSNLLFHEDQHRKGVPGDGWSHFAIASAQTRHWSFDKMSDAGKSFIKGTMRGYLNEDMEGYMNSEIFFAGSKENALKILNSESFQNAYKSYQDNVNTYNSTFNESYEAKDYESLINEVYDE